MGKALKQQYSHQDSIVQGSRPTCKVLGLCIWEHIYIFAPLSGAAEVHSMGSAQPVFLWVSPC